MTKTDLVGRRCRSNDYFATQFSITIARNKGKPLVGLIIDDHDHDLVTVKWRTLKTPWRRLSRTFLVVEEKGEQS